MIRVTALRPNGPLERGGPELLGPPGRVWIDVVAPTAEQLEDLAARYGLHKLAVEDCLNLDQRPKVEEYPGHWFVVLHGFTCPGKDVAELQLHEVHAFLGPDLLITVHDRAHPALDATWERVAAEPAETLGRGADFVHYLIADALVDAHFPLFDRFDDEISDLEDQAFEKPSREQLERAFALKRGLVHLRKVLSPQRDVVAQLARGAVGPVTERTRLFYRDVYDHLVRLYEHIDAARDLLSNAMDAWLSVVANRTNEITRQLTIFATLFLPMSFVVGFFGQNFEVLASRPFFGVMVASLVGIPIGMYLWFRHKEWT